VGDEPALCVRGACYAMFAYDIGFAIDLDGAQRLLAAGAGGAHREVIKHHRRAPQYFQFRPAPLGVRQEAEPIAVSSSWATEPAAELVIYDFGAVSVTYRIPLDGPLEGLLDLSDAIYDHGPLLADSRRRVESLLRTIREAVVSPAMVDLVEDYVVYQFDRCTAGAPAGDAIGPQAVVDRAGRTLARILRSERGPLSDQETADALAARISYSTEDQALIDFGAAVLFMPGGEGATEVRDVLWFANVELLEMRYLDDRLDAALDRSYEALSRDSLRSRLALGSDAADLARLARLQADGAVLFEAVNNALKLIGDHYLARLYRLAAQRLHLPDWDASVLRKLQIVESIYDKLSDRQATRRMELLEWIIIILIALSIVMALVPGLGH
jgi:hypothetical protein